MRQATYLLLPVLLIAAGGIPTVVNGADWSPTPAPVLDPVGIKVGGGLVYPCDTVITVVEGDTVTLAATSKDYDTKDCTAPTVPDTAEVVWSVSPGGGTLSNARVASEVPVTWTAPTLDPNETYRSCTITAQPDDNTTTDPGNRPAGDTGNRNDVPGTGVRLWVKVIKNCPTNIALTDTCSPTFAWMFANVTINSSAVKTAGFTTAQMRVSGGTPPNPPSNWNGMFIKESMQLHQDGNGTAVDGDFDVAGYRAACCTPTVQGFVVHSSPGTFGSCARAAADDRFWDDHSNFAIIPVLKSGKADKTIICEQQYLCKTTPLITSGTKSLFSIYRFFHESTYGGNRVTEVTVTKIAD